MNAHNLYMRNYRKESEVYQKQIQSPVWKWGVWKTRLRLRYHVTPEWVGEKFLEQQGKCAVCREDIYYNVWGDRKDKTFSLHVDHNHETGKSRGLLCQSCNIGIGKLLDDRQVVLAAFSYLSFYDEQ